jgi:histidinol-phosphatase (PHP family)
MNGTPADSMERQACLNRRVRQSRQSFFNPLAINNLLAKNQGCNFRKATMSLLLTDGHTHPYCHTRSLAGMRTFAEAALAQGLQGMVFTEHAPLAEHWPWDKHFLSRQEYPLYLDYAEQLQAEFSGRLRIGVGLEVDYHPENLSNLEKLLSRRHFDHVGVSLHMHLNYWQEELSGRTEAEQVRAALKHTMAAVCSGLGTGLNHFDFFRVRMPWYDPAPFEEDIRAIFEAMVKHGVALELNTNGWKRFNEPMPCDVVWGWSLEYPLRRTVGSDAHRVTEVGQYFAQAKQRVDACLARRPDSLDGISHGRQASIEP